MSAVALAFESGGAAEACARTLEVLRAAEVRATIFLDGRWAEANPALVRAMVVDGHELGNHAYSHPDLTTLLEEEIAAELERTEAVALGLAGRSTRPWFRPPYQRLDDHVRVVAARLGFRCLVRDALDGAHYLGPSTAEAITARSLARAADGVVLTYHLQSPRTAEALGGIVAGLRDAGGRLVPVSDLPAPPPERASLHDSFQGLPVDPGYLRMHRPLAPPQMVNLLALGAEVLAPVDRLLPLGAGDGGETEGQTGRDGMPGSSLFVFSGKTPQALPAAAGERHVACLAGEAVLELSDAGGPVGTALCRPGDTVQVRNGWGVRILPWQSRRAVLLVIA